MKLVWAERAQRDLTEIADYIAQGEVSAAVAWVDKIAARAKTLAAAPLANRRVPEIDRDDIREAIVGSYRLVYRVEKTRLVVLTVFEGHRLLVNALTGGDDESP